MSRRDVEAQGQEARHARSRLQHSLATGSRDPLLEVEGQPEFRYGGVSRSGDGQAGQGRGRSSEGLESFRNAGPDLRWRLSRRLAVLLAILALTAGSWFWWQAAGSGTQVLPLDGASSGAGRPEAGATAISTEGSAGGSRASPGMDASEGSPAQEVVVHVAGAVAAPGVVQLPAGSRVHEAIAAAGGGSPGAALNQLNLALVLTDGQKIQVPREGEPPPTDTTAPGGPTVTGPDGVPDASAPTKINLNSAGVQELGTLPRVGPVLAQRIVDWRREHGPFTSVEELDAVDGVGPKMLEALLPLVAV